jgi:hypothetical protein
MRLLRCLLGSQGADGKWAHSMPWIARCFLVLIAAATVAATSAACTRRGGGLPPVGPTAGPGTTIYVDPRTGNDAKCAATGSSAVAPTPPPCKTLTHALALLPKPSPTTSSRPSPSSSASPSAYPSATPTPFNSGVTIDLAPGDYSHKSGEVFPIVVPVGVTIDGAGGSSAAVGSFIDGAGEDVNYERASHAPAHNVYVTLEITGSNVDVSGIFAGASTPPRSGKYYAVDVLGQAAFSTSEFPAPAGVAPPNINGVIVPSGQFTCDSCVIFGYDGIVALTLPASSVAPSITLSKTASDAQVKTGNAGIETDGSANVSASTVAFEGGKYAYADDLPPLRAGMPPGTVDFGFGAGGSLGGNTFLDGFITHELFVTRTHASIVALDDTWNPVQGANAYGQYATPIRFTRLSPPGKNVAILHSAVGSYVDVGPKSAPTPSPSPTPYPSSSPSPTASPT